MTPTRVADVLAGALVRRGVKVAFHVPGGEVLTVLDALREAGIELVLARQESAAALMAQGVARETGTIGVVVATVGPGATSAVNGVAAAHQDRVPLLVVTGALDADDLGRGFTHQALDQVALYTPVTKRSMALRAGTAASDVEDAIELALRPRAGPVHLDVPSLVAAAPCLERAPAARLEADTIEPATLERMAQILAGAERPLVVVGLDALSAPAEARALALAADAPVLSTYLAKGVVDERSPSHLGAFGLSPAFDAALLPLVQRADVILRLGYDPIETRVAWTQPFARETVLLDLACVPAGPSEARAELAVHHPSLGPPAAELTRQRSLRSQRPRWPGPELAAARAAIVAAGAKMDATPAGQLVLALERALPEDARVTVDTGAHRILFSQRWRARRPGRLVQSTGLCTMACGLPLAIGIHCARPDLPVVAVTGDGGLEMCLGELATLRDVGGPLAIVVLDDQALELIALKQRQLKLAAVGCESGGTDFAAIGRAMGGHGVRVETPDALGPAVTAALAADRFTVIHCPIPRGSYDGVL